MPGGRGFLCCCGFIKSQALKCCVSNPLLTLPGWEVTQNSRPTPYYPKRDALGSLCAPGMPSLAWRSQGGGELAGGRGDTHPPPCPNLWLQGGVPPVLLQEMPSVSVLDYALPQRPLQARDEERDPSERALPRRSSSPIIGSPPVRAIPIGTPPKQAAIPNFNQQVSPHFSASYCSQGCKLLPKGSHCATCLLPDPVSQACPHPSYHAAALSRSLWREDVPQPALQCSGIQLSLLHLFGD